MECDGGNGNIRKNIGCYRWDICCKTIDIGKAAAAIEGIVADTGHAIADGDGGQSAATTVFANLFLSAIYILNGRKVATKVL